jgi:hypothetical protein
MKILGTNSRTTAGRSKAVSCISKSANENTFTQYVESMNIAKKFRNTVEIVNLALLVYREGLHEDSWNNLASIFYWAFHFICSWY